MSTSGSGTNPVNKNSTSNLSTIKSDYILKSFVKSYNEKINSLIEQIHNNNSIENSLIIENQSRSIIEAVNKQFDCYIIQLINVIQSQIELLVKSWNYQKILDENRHSGKEVDSNLSFIFIEKTILEIFC